MQHTQLKIVPNIYWDKHIMDCGEMAETAKNSVIYSNHRISNRHAPTSSVHSHLGICPLSDNLR